MEGSFSINHKVQVFYFKLQNDFLQKSINVEFNGFNICGICTSNNISKSSNEYFVIINENFIGENFENEINVKLHSYAITVVEERNIKVPKNLFYNEYAISVEVNGNLNKKVILAENTEEKIFAGLLEINIDFFLSHFYHF